MCPIRSRSRYFHSASELPRNPISSQPRWNCFSPIFIVPAGSSMNQRRTEFPKRRRVNSRNSSKACRPRCRGDGLLGLGSASSATSSRSLEDWRERVLVDLLCRGVCRERRPDGGGDMPVRGLDESWPWEARLKHLWRNRWRRQISTTAGRRETSAARWATILSTCCKRAAASAAAASADVGLGNSPTSSSSRSLMSRKARAACLKATRLAPRAARRKFASAAVALRRSSATTCRCCASSCAMVPPPASRAMLRE
mmetsp:Transcript_95512/g.204967  ORF Transcript_95512/g.204967 Transcript_95512/m.204967 type:complete len:255 (-) Transcript_95512:17-781(-)